MKESFNYRRSSMPPEEQKVKVCRKNCTEGCAICPYRDCSTSTDEEKIDDAECN